MMWSTLQWLRAADGALCNLVEGGSADLVQAVQRGGTEAVVGAVASHIRSHAESFLTLRVRTILSDVTILPDPHVVESRSKTVGRKRDS